MTTLKKMRWPIVLFMLFAAGILICFLRTPYSILEPVMYAEDGTWSGSLMQNGFLATCLTARQDYLVVGNILLLQFALSLNTLLFGSNIEHLPVLVAVVSYAYYSMVALLPLILLRRVLDWRALLVLWLLILLLPMGYSISETYGRIVNVGYGCFFLGFTILVWFCFSEPSKRNIFILLSYLAMVVLCMTNPACYLLLATMFLYELYGAIKRKAFPWPSIVRYVCMAIVSLASLALMLSIQQHGLSESVISTEMSGPRGVIAFFFRSIAYDFCWPIYRHFNTLSALIVLGLIVSFYALAFYFTHDARYRKIMAFSYAWTIIITVISILMRAGLTGMLEGYYTSFPDRYFYMQQTMILFDTCLVISAALSGVMKSKPIRIAILILCCYLILINMAKWDTVFEIHGSKLVQTDTTFAESLREAIANGPDADGLFSIDVQIPFEGWEMLVPQNYLETSSDAH